MIVFTGSMEDRWEDVARTAAENGGTHYYARTKYVNPRFVTHGSAYTSGGFTAGSSTTRFEQDEQNVVVVYRREDETCEMHDD